MRWLKPSALDIVLAKGYLTSWTVYPVKWNSLVYLLYYHTKYIFLQDYNLLFCYTETRS